MGFLNRLIAIKRVANKSKLNRYPAIVVFIGSGALCTYMFFLVTSLPALQGASDHMLQVAVSFAWVLIFPLWIILFSIGLVLLDIIERKFGT